MHIPNLGIYMNNLLRMDDDAINFDDSNNLDDSDNIWHFFLLIEQFVLLWKSSGWWTFF